MFLTTDIIVTYLVMYLTPSTIGLLRHVSKQFSNAFESKKMSSTEFLINEDVLRWAVSHNSPLPNLCINVPMHVLRFAIRHNFNLKKTMLSAIHNGDIKLLKFAYENNYDNSSILEDIEYNSIVNSQQLKCIKYLSNYNKCINRTCLLSIVDNGNLEFLKCVKWNCDYYYSDEILEMLQRVIYRNHFRCYEYIISKTPNIYIYYLRYNCMCEAEFGRLEFIKHSHKLGCRLLEATAIMAAKNGHLDCIKYIHQSGIRMTENVCLAAVNKNDYIECLKYIHQNGDIMPKQLYNICVEFKRKQCLQYYEKFN